MFGTGDVRGSNDIRLLEDPRLAFSSVTLSKLVRLRLRVVNYSPGALLLSRYWLIRRKSL